MKNILFLTLLSLSSTYAMDLGECKDKANDKYEKCVGDTNSADVMEKCNNTLLDELTKCEDTY